VICSFLFDFTRYTLSRPRFRWVACQIDVLKNCLDYPRLRKALNTLPKTLDETYARILESIPNEHSTQAATILNLLIWSKWNFKINELVDATATNLDEDPPFDSRNRMPAPRDVLRVCSSLVSVSLDDIRNPDTETVQLAHFSVKEYLFSNHISGAFKSLICETIARSYLAKLCLTYLIGISQLTVRDRLVSSLGPDEIKSEFPFAYYAVSSWIMHTHKVESEDESLCKLVLSFFLEKRMAFSLFGILCGSAINGKKSPVYYAAGGGLIRTVESLLNRGANIDAEDGAALQAALRNGEHATARLLLDRGADANAGYGQALLDAVIRIDHTTVQLLLDRGADINIRRGEALLVAVHNAQDSTVQLLLNRGADVNVRDGQALMGAVVLGTNKTIELLLSGGADVNVRDGQVLIHAVVRGLYSIVQLLLESGADINAGNGESLTAAVKHGRHTIAQLLLDRGADVDLNHGEVLRGASRWGNVTSVQMLLERGADPNAHSESTLTALQEALGRGYDKLVELQLEGFSRVTALKSPPLEAYHNIARLLLVEGADINVPGGLWFDTLHESGWNAPNVQWILGINPYLSLNHLLSAMSDVEPQAEAIVSVMLPYIIRKVAVTAGDHWPVWRLLHYAAICGSETVTQRCIDLSADVNAQDGHRRTALHYAAERGYLAVMKILVRSGADTNAFDDNRETPLMLARDDPKNPYVSSHLQRRRRTPRHLVVEYLLSLGCGEVAQTPIQEMYFP
jgi:ankyrin repeat protein